MEEKFFCDGFVRRISDFSPEKIAASGQCFRMRHQGDEFTVTAGARFLRFSRRSEDEFFFACTEAEFEDFWRGYFDLDADYAQYIASVPKSDRYMLEAIQAGKGLRILRQQPWEMLITFLLSQRKAIPLIKRSVEQLCSQFGTKIAGTEEAYAFTTPEQLARASTDELAACGLGYRTKYVQRAAEAAASGQLDMAAWTMLADEDLKQALMALYGVGIKVASCVMLFGYHRLDAVPVDVWMERASKAYYGGKFPYEGVGSYAGVLQQYIFEYIRAHNAR